MISGKNDRYLWCSGHSSVKTVQFFGGKFLTQAIKRSRHKSRCPIGVTPVWHRVSQTSVTLHIFWRDSFLPDHFCLINFACSFLPDQARFSFELPSTQNDSTRNVLTSLGSVLVSVVGWAYWPVDTRLICSADKSFRCLGPLALLGLVSSLQLSIGNCSVLRERPPHSQLHFCVACLRCAMCSRSSRFIKRFNFARANLSHLFDFVCSSVYVAEFSTLLLISMSALHDHLILLLLQT